MKKYLLLLMASMLAGCASYYYDDYHDSYYDDGYYDDYVVRTDRYRGHRHHGYSAAYYPYWSLDHFYLGTQYHNPFYFSAGRYDPWYRSRYAYRYRPFYNTHYGPYLSFGFGSRYYGNYGGYGYYDPWYRPGYRYRGYRGNRGGDHGRHRPGDGDRPGRGNRRIAHDNDAIDERTRERESMRRGQRGGENARRPERQQRRIIASNGGNTLIRSKSAAEHKTGRMKLHGSSDKPKRSVVRRSGPVVTRSGEPVVISRSKQRARNGIVRRSAPVVSRGGEEEAAETSESNAQRGVVRRSRTVAGRQRQPVAAYSGNQQVRSRQAGRYKSAPAPDRARLSRARTKPVVAAPKVRPPQRSAPAPRQSRPAPVQPKSRPAPPRRAPERAQNDNRKATVSNRGKDRRNPD